MRRCESIPERRLQFSRGVDQGLHHGRQTRGLRGARRGPSSRGPRQDQGYQDLSHRNRRRDRLPGMSSARLNSFGGESSSHRSITASVCAGLALGLLGAAAGAPALASTTLSVSTCDSGAANPPACNRPCPRRPRRGLAGAGPLGSHGAQRHGHHQPAAGGGSGARDPAQGRQCGRCRGRTAAVLNV